MQILSNSRYIYFRQAVTEPNAKSILGEIVHNLDFLYLELQDIFAQPYRNLAGTGTVYSTVGSCHWMLGMISRAACPVMSNNS